METVDYVEEVPLFVDFKALLKKYNIWKQSASNQKSETRWNKGETRVKQGEAMWSKVFLENIK